MTPEGYPRTSQELGESRGIPFAPIPDPPQSGSSLISCRAVPCRPKGTLEDPKDETRLDEDWMNLVRVGRPYPSPLVKLQLVFKSHYQTETISKNWL